MSSATAKCFGDRAANLAIRTATEAGRASCRDCSGDMEICKTLQTFCKFDEAVLNFPLSKRDS